jgi:hypothetical protein
MPTFLADILVDVFELAFSYFLEKVRLVLCSERVVSLQNNEQKYSQTP